MGIALKRHLIESFAKSSTINGLDQNKIILTTAIGLIAGKLVSVSPFTPENPEELCKINGTVSSNYTEARLYETLLASVRETYKGEADGNDGYILLADVSIRTINGSFNLGTQVVFFDQIIGISLGNIE